MSKLDELIQQLCPDGVDSLTIENVCIKITSGGTPNTSRNDYYEGDIPWLRTQEVDWNDITDTGVKITNQGLENSSAKWIEKNCVIVAMYGATAAKVAINKIPLTTNQACCNLCVDQNKANYRYVYHWLCNKYEEIKALGQGSQSNINAKIVRGIPIAVPPLPIQNEIIRILDNFTELAAELAAELTAELTARKKQYEYYRDQLLTFVEDDVNFVTLNEISKNHDSKRKPVKQSKREKGLYPYYGASGIVDYVNDYLFDGEYLLVSEDGANLIARNTPIAFSVSGKTWVNNHAHILEFDDYATRRYVEIYLNSIDLGKYLSTAAQPKLTQENLNKIPVPFPDSEKRARIVSILDRFDSLCNDITTGLPAEIEARRKQYEYYRDKLLTFKELGA